MAHGHSHHHRHVQRDILSEIGNLLGINSNPQPTQGSQKSNVIQGNGNPAVSVVYVTESATFTGAVGGYITQTHADATTTANPKAVGPPVKHSQTTAPTDTQPAPTGTAKTEPTSATEKSSETSSSISSSTTEVPSTSTGAPTTTFSTAAATTSILAATTALSAGVQEASSVPSPTPSVSASTSAGLSGGAKAGIAIGVLLGLAAIAGLVLFWLHKQKKNREAAAAADNEKSFAPSQPPMMSANPMRPSQPATPSTPPQVSLRPLTEFNPTLDVGRSYGGNALAAGALGAGVGAAAAAAATRNLTGKHSGTANSPSPSQGSPNPFNDPVNPFENGEEVSSPPTPVAKDLPLAAETSPSPTGSASGVPAGLVAGKPASEAANAAAIGVAVGGAVGGAAVAASKAAEKEPRQQRTPSPEYREGSPEGSSGSRPQSPVVGGAPFVSNVHRVQMDFAPSLADEMEMKAGQLVRLLKNYDDGWTQCSSMDGSIKGIAPRSCLSARPLQPRNHGPPGGGRPASPGPRTMGPNGRPMSPAGAGRRPGGPSPTRFYQDGRPMSPVGGRPRGASPSFPAPPPGRSMSPGPGRPSADLPRPLTPGGSSRPSSPIGGGPRSRSNSASVGMMQTRPIVPPGPSPLAAAPPPTGPVPGPPSPPIIHINDQPQPIERKPVPSAPTSSN